MFYCVCYFKELAFISCPVLGVWDLLLIACRPRRRLGRVIFCDLHTNLIPYFRKLITLLFFGARESGSLGLGLIAMRAGIGSGAEAILIPESKNDHNKLIEKLKKEYGKGGSEP